MTLTPATEPQCYVILDAATDPAAFGYIDATPLHTEEGFVLYHRFECE
jgi:hypothetical protein